MWIAVKIHICSVACHWKHVPCDQLIGRSDRFQVVVIHAQLLRHLLNQKNRLYDGIFKARSQHHLWGDTLLMLRICLVLIYVVINYNNIVCLLATIEQYFSDRSKYTNNK